jgi:Zn ribbon nucleic-acid-binding protein
MGEPSTEPAGVSSGTGMRCPTCKSTNVECTSDKRAHVHECHDCGYRTESAPVKR